MGQTASKPSKSIPTLARLIAKGDVEAVRRELGSGVSVNADLGNGNTPLHVAAHLGRDEIVDLLVSSGANLSAENSNGDEAVIVALRAEHAALASKIQQAKSGNQPGGDLISVLLGEMVSGMRQNKPSKILNDAELDERLGALLRGSGAKSPSPKTLQHQLHEAALHGDATKVEEALARGAELDAVDTDGDTALHVAALASCGDVVKLLLKRGADWSIRNRRGMCPIHLAAGRGDSEIVELLLQHGAEVDAHGHDGDTALTVAAAMGQGDVISVLLRYGADATRLSSEGNPPIVTASYAGHLEAVQALVAAGCDVNATGKKGGHALYLACQNGHLETAVFLMDHGAKLDQKTANGATAAVVAAVTNHVEILDALLDRGVPVDESDKDGDTLLLLAAMAGYTDVVRLLVSRGANLEARFKDGRTALLVAAKANKVEMATVLLDAGANVDCRSKADMTPLWVAAASGHLAVVELLISRGAKLDTRDRLARKTALDVAKAGNHSDVVRALELAARKAPGATPFAPPRATAVRVVVPPPQALSRGKAHHDRPSIFDIIVNRAEKLGDGSVGTVFGGVRRSTGEQLAIKAIKLRGGEKGSEQLEAEVNALCEVATGQCPYIVRVCGPAVDLDNNEMLIVMERAERSLADELDELQGAAPDPLRVARVAMQITLALKYLHTPRGEDGNSGRWLHLDLKPQQILLFNDGTVAKLCDFSIAVTIDRTAAVLNTSRATAGTTNYKAPEQFDRQLEKGPFTDVYGLGALLWQWLRGGQQPWSGVAISEIFGDMMRGTGLVAACGPAYPGVAAGQPLPVSASEAQRMLADLSERCLRCQRAERPTVDEIIDDLDCVVSNLL